LIIYLSLYPSSIVNTQGYFTKGKSGQGGAVYFTRGIVDSNKGEDIILAVYSELQNGTSAKGWEVSVAVLPNPKNISYVMDIRDSHLALDPAVSNDAVLSPNEGESIGERNFGPWNVYPGADYPSLEWRFYVYSRDFSEIYAYMILIWGYSNRGPPKIVGSPDIESNATGGIGSGTIHPRVVLFTAISLIFAAKRAYDKSVNTRISEEEAIVK